MVQRWERGDSRAGQIAGLQGPGKRSLTRWAEHPPSPGQGWEGVAAGLCFGMQQRLRAGGVTGAFPQESLPCLPWPLSLYFSLLLP